MKHVRALVVLETMWGSPRERAPNFFRINPSNFSGRRLYWLLGHDDFYVTNACRELVGSPNHHGTPDPERLAKNLGRIEYDLLLLGGQVAQRTFDGCGYAPSCRIERMPHPAARTWTRQSLDEWKQRLQR